MQGLDSGADDYLPKPFEFEELLARVRALMRRRGDQVDDPTYRLADLEIDFLAQRVQRAGAPVDLTTKEFTLLAYLARNAGRVVGRAELWLMTAAAISLLGVALSHRAAQPEAGAALG